MVHVKHDKRSSFRIFRFYSVWKDVVVSSLLNSKKWLWMFHEVLFLYRTIRRKWWKSHFRDKAEVYLVSMISIGNGIKSCADIAQW
jgi:hypothetical protein